MVLFLYSGFFIGWLRTPNWWDWMGFVSPQSYAYSIMLQLQYLQHEFDCYHDGASYAQRPVSVLFIEVVIAVVGPCRCGCGTDAVVTESPPPLEWWP